MVPWKKYRGEMQPSSELRFAAISKFVIIYNQVRGELDQHILLWGKLISYVPPLFENKCRGTTLIFEWREYVAIGWIA